MTELIYDYRHGFVINAETGEVVDQIFSESIIDGFERSTYAGFIERIHYSKMQRIPSDKKARKIYILCRSLLSALGINSVNNDELNRVVENVIQIYREQRMEIKLKPLAVVATYHYAKHHGIVVDIERLCLEMQLDRFECKLARSFAIRASESLKIDRVKLIAKEITTYDRHPDVTAVALVLLRYANIDGRSCKPVAAALIYAASMLLGKDGVEVTQKAVAKHFNVSTASVRRIDDFVPIKVVRSCKGYVTERVAVPKSICEDVSRVARLSERVVCI